jgi:hypothetical protein
MRIGESFDGQSRMKNGIFAHIVFSYSRWGHETPNAEWPTGRSNALFAGHGMVDRQAQRWGSRAFSIPAFLPLTVLMIFWLFRVLFTK